ncbi:Oxidoreductase HTATIP2 [Trichinella spiralis]|uniref:Oxidoreductase HTATIP2 n=1 Tax=Trichinella spiralis TaxID=6334 RepID=A0ABR3KBS5_TRISP
MHLLHQIQNRWDSQHFLHIALKGYILYRLTKEIFDDLQICRLCVLLYSRQNVQLIYWIMLSSVGTGTNVNWTICSGAENPSPIV